MDEVASNADRLYVMNHGRVAMSGEPREVFAHAEALERMGLDVPRMTSLFLRLRQLGMPVDPSVYTVEQAREAILSLCGRDASC